MHWPNVKYCELNKAAWPRPHGPYSRSLVNYMQRKESMKKVTERVKFKSTFNMVLEESPVTKFGSHDEGRLLSCESEPEPSTISAGGSLVVPIAVSGEEEFLEDF